MKNYSGEAFSAAMRKVDFFQVINCENVNECWYIFKNLFFEQVDAIAPIKEVHLKQRSEHWFNSDLLESISKRDKAYRRYKSSNDQTKYRI